MHLVKVVDSFGAVHEVVAQISVTVGVSVQRVKDDIVRQNPELIKIMPELRINTGALNIKDMFYLG